MTTLAGVSEITQVNECKRSWWHRFVCTALLLSQLAFETAPIPAYRRQTSGAEKNRLHSRATPPAGLNYVTDCCVIVLASCDVRKDMYRACCGGRFVKLPVLLFKTEAVKNSRINTGNTVVAVQSSPRIVQMPGWHTLFTKHWITRDVPVDSACPYRSQRASYTLYATCT